MNGTGRKPDKSAPAQFVLSFYWYQENMRRIGVTKLQYYQPVPVKFVNQIQMLLAFRKGEGVKMHQGV